jgi:hypothetical protein
MRYYHITIVLQAPPQDSLIAWQSEVSQNALMLLRSIAHGNTQRDLGFASDRSLGSVCEGEGVA